MDIVTISSVPKPPGKSYGLGRRWLMVIVAGAFALALLLQVHSGLLLVLPWLLVGLVLILLREVSRAVFDLVDRLSAQQAPTDPPVRARRR